MSESPGIFIEDFSRDALQDRQYAVIGRAVWLATRFENGCKTAAIMLGVKGGRLHAEVISAGGGDYAEALESFVVTQRSKQLNAVVQNMSAFLVHKEAAEILHAARRARNEIAHEAASGFDYAITEPEILARVHTSIREAVRAIAEGDRLVSIILSQLNGDPILVGDAMASYVDRVVDWVCDIQPQVVAPPNSR